MGPCTDLGTQHSLLLMPNQHAVPPRAVAGTARVVPSPRSRRRSPACRPPVHADTALAARSKAASPSSQRFTIAWVGATSLSCTLV